MKPESRPISFTRPMPFCAASASALAAYVARRASLTAVSNPNVFWTNDTSLSIVLGTPITLIASPCLLRLRADRVRASQRSVTANREQDADPELSEPVDHCRGRLRTA